MIAMRRALLSLLGSGLGLWALGGCGAAPGQAPTTASDRKGGPATTAPAERSEEPLTELQAACRAGVEDLAGKLPAGASLAVLPFFDSDGAVRRAGVLASEEVERILLDRSARLVDRRHLDLVFREKDLQMTADASGETLRRTGKLAGADVLIVGSLTLAGPRVLVGLRAVDVRTGRPLGVAQARTVAAAPLANLMWYVRRPAVQSAGGELPPLSLRYELLCPGPRGEASLADGSTVPSGQRFKLRLQANSDCYLYVLLYDSRSKASVLFPHREVALSNQVRGGVSYEVPPGSTWYWLDNHPGLETFYLVASYVPLEDLDALLRAMQQGDGAARAAAARDQIDRAAKGMSPATAQPYQPSGLTVRAKGVGGVVDVGWGAPSPASAAGVDNVVSGFATVVKKVTLHHR